MKTVEARRIPAERIIELWLSPDEGIVEIIVRGNTRQWKLTGEIKQIEEVQNEAVAIHSSN